MKWLNKILVKITEISHLLMQLKLRKLTAVGRLTDVEGNFKHESLRKANVKTNFFSIYKFKRSNFGKTENLK